MSLIFITLVYHLRQMWTYPLLKFLPSNVLAILFCAFEIQCLVGSQVYYCYAYSLYELGSSKVSCSLSWTFLYAFEWMEVPHSNHLVFIFGTLSKNHAKRVNEFEQSVDTNVDLARLTSITIGLRYTIRFQAPYFLEGDSIGSQWVNDLV
jgi:hypothetical protein